MRKLGLIGGSGWPSTLEYYHLLNTYFCQESGSDHALDMILRNLNFALFRQLLASERRAEALKMLLEGALDCKRAGADFLAFSANGLHRFLPEIEDEIGLPIVHIAEATALEVSKMKLQKVGLLGVRATMEGNFYPEYLHKLGIALEVPNEDDKAMIHRIVFDELVHGKFTKQSKNLYLQAMDRLVAQGAQGIILGCTEIPLLLNQSDFRLPLFATTEIHCRAIINFARQ